MVETAAAGTPERVGHAHLVGNPALGLTMGTWGFFVDFAAVALYGPAAKYFQDQMRFSSTPTTCPTKRCASAG